MSELTVVQLKEELRRNGVSFSEGRLKKYYVDLHSSMSTSSRSKSTGSSSSLDFSDDESQVSSSPRRRRSIVRTQLPGTPSKLAKAPSDLSDAQLRSELVKQGHTPGPITESTRDVYRRMLQDGPGTPSKRDTPSRKPASAPGTPAKKQSVVKSIDMSDDEADGGVVDVVPRSATRSSATLTPRRRTEVDRLKIDNPGPQMAQTVPPSAEGIRTRSRRSVPGTVAANNSGLTGGSGACQTTCADNRQSMIMLFIFALIAISVVFALRFGLPAKLPLPSPPK